MSQTIQLEIVSRVLIKPTGAVPNHPRIHTLSLFDQLSPLAHVPLIYFYTKEVGQNIADTPTALKTSLCKILSRWYTLAGRIRPDNAFIIDCNDEGAVFIEGKTRCKLSEFLSNRRDENIELLLPDDLQHKDGNLLVPLVVQVRVFECGGMAKLQHLVEHQVQNPTRVELVLALIFRHVMIAARTTSGRFQPIGLAQTINMRRRASSSLPDNLVGNFCGTFQVEMKPVQDSGLELSTCVEDIRQQKKEYFNACKSASSGQELSFLLLKTVQKLIEFCSRVDFHTYICSSWCKFPVYEADFGWGKPTWITTATRKFKPKNSIIIMDAREGGIEVNITMAEEEMVLFQCDEELLAFASIM